MAFENYTALIAGTVDFLARADVTTAKVEYSISLLESAFNRNCRVKEMESQTAALTLTTSSLSGSTSIITHPSDWLAWKSIKVVTSPPTDVEIATQVNALHDLGYDSPGRPVRAFVQNGVTELWPAPDASYTYRYVYYAKVPALTSAAPTNWLLTKYPDVYFLGAMAVTSSFLIDEPRAAMFKAAFDRATAEVQSASRRDEFSGQPLRPIVRGVV